MHPTDNYFDLFGIPPAFTVEPAQIESKYRELQSRFHPDRHAIAGAREKRLAVEGAARINEAYAVLSDDCARAAYLLELQGLQLGGEPDTVDDPEFLVEQMELREALEEAAAADRPAAALTRLERDADERMTALSGGFERAYGDGNLDAARETVLKMKFIKKFREEIGGERRRSFAADLQK